MLQDCMTLSLTSAIVETTDPPLVAGVLRDGGRLNYAPSSRVRQSRVVCLWQACEASTLFGLGERVLELVALLPPPLLPVKRTIQTVSGVRPSKHSPGLVQLGTHFFLVLLCSVHASTQCAALNTRINAGSLQPRRDGSTTCSESDDG